MDIAQAKDILRSLADGRDSAAGQQFPPDSPYLQSSPESDSPQSSFRAKPVPSDSLAPRPALQTAPQRNEALTEEEKTTCHFERGGLTDQEGTNDIYP